MNIRVQQLQFEIYYTFATQCLVGSHLEILGKAGPIVMMVCSLTILDGPTGEVENEEFYKVLEV